MKTIVERIVGDDGVMTGERTFTAKDRPSKRRIQRRALEEGALISWFGDVPELDGRAYISEGF